MIFQVDIDSFSTASSWEEVSERGDASEAEAETETDSWEWVDNGEWRFPTSGTKNNRLSYRDAVLLPIANINNELTPKGSSCCANKQKKEKKLNPTFENELTLLDDEHLFEKPMSNKRRLKYRDSGKRRFLRGHTGRWKWTKDRDGVSTLVGSGNQNNEKERSVTAMELAWGNGTRKYHSEDREWNLNKRGAWEKVPELLDLAACATNDGKTRQLSSSRDAKTPVSIYKLQVLSTQRIHRGKEEAALLRDTERRARTIFYKPLGTPPLNSTKAIPKRIFFELNKEKPEIIKNGELMPWKLSSRSHAPSLGRKTLPLINGNRGLFMEDVPLFQGKRFVEIDLGQQRLVTAVSTQGGPPPVRSFPGRKNDVEYPKGISTNYKGPFWNVFDPDMDFWDGSRYRQVLQWVRSYDLQYRVDRGREWHSLGQFRANVDTTTERAHCLPHGLYCRYLRFIPTECEGKGALRVGVYGLMNKGSNADDLSPRFLNDFAPAENAEFVEYKLFSSLSGSDIQHREYGQIRWKDNELSAQKRRREIRAATRKSLACQAGMGD